MNGPESQSGHAAPDHLDDDVGEDLMRGDPAEVLRAIQDDLTRLAAHGPLEALIRAHVRACRSATRLGRLDDAIESGLLARHLVDCGPAAMAATLQLQAIDALAGAMAWRQQGDTALAMLHQLRAAPPARLKGTDLDRWHLRLSLQIGDVLAWRQALGGTGRTERPHALLQQTLDEARHHARALPGSARTAWRLGWLTALCQVWQADTPQARQHLAALRRRPPSLHVDETLAPLWVAVLIAQVQQDAAALEAASRRLADEAAQRGHQPLADLGERRLAQCLLDQGRDAEMRQRAELTARRRQGTDALPLPTSARLSRYLAQVQASDLRSAPPMAPTAATSGLQCPPPPPSREQFLAQARQTVPAPAGQSCAALLLSARDTDPPAAPQQERLLETLVHLIGRTLRTGDLATRWSAEQVAVLLRQASADDAARVCQRLAEAVQKRDWSTLTDDHLLQIDISHAQASPGDTVETLMQRCEAEMAAGRRQRRRIAVCP